MRLIFLVGFYFVFSSIFYFSLEAQNKPNSASPKPQPTAEQLETWYSQGLEAYLKKDFKTAFPIFKKAANFNLHNAAYMLGHMYSGGEATAQNADSAIFWYKKAAEGNVLNSNSLIAGLYDKKKDYANAIVWYKKAGEQNDTTALYNLGLIYAQGKGGAVDEIEAKKCFKKACEANMKDACVAAKNIKSVQQRLESTQSAGTKYSDEAVDFYNAAIQADSAKDYKKAFVLFQKAYKAGMQEETYFALGYAYHLGQGTKVNLDSAIFWYEKAALKNEVMAQLNLGIIYQGKKNYPKAFLNLKKAALQKNESAYNSLGVYYLDKKAPHYQLDSAIHWFTLAANQKHLQAMGNLGTAYKIKKDYKNAVLWYEKALAANSSAAFAALGTLYLEGKGVEKNYDKALALFRQGVAKGSTQAYNNIGLMFHNGQGVKYNLDSAMYFYKKANVPPSNESQNNIGTAHQSKKEYKQAAEIFRKLAAEGHAVSQINLGKMYEKGIGAKQNLDSARYWYEKALAQDEDIAYDRMGDWYAAKEDYTKALTFYKTAAEREVYTAYTAIGNFYAQGLGLKKDEKQALTWYKKAAENEEPLAQYILGAAYASGMDGGLQINLLQSQQWYEKSCSHGFELACEALKKK
jgi:TPR repeat protein